MFSGNELEADVRSTEPENTQQGNLCSDTNPALSQDVQTALMGRFEAKLVSTSEADVDKKASRSEFIAFDSDTLLKSSTTVNNDSPEEQTVDSQVLEEGEEVQLRAKASDVQLESDAQRFFDHISMDTRAAVDDVINSIILRIKERLESKAEADVQVNDVGKIANWSEDSHTSESGTCM